MRAPRTCNCIAITPLEKKSASFTHTQTKVPAHLHEPAHDNETDPLALEFVLFFDLRNAAVRAYLGLFGEVQKWLYDTGVDAHPDGSIRAEWAGTNKVFSSGEEAHMLFELLNSPGAFCFDLPLLRVMYYLDC